MFLLRNLARGLGLCAIIFVCSQSTANAGTGSEARKATIAAETALQKAAARKEFECLARAIYFEARGESEAGQLAVGRVILNRVGHGVYPDTICGVVYENRHLRNRCQFSFACDGTRLTIRDTQSWQDIQVLTAALLACDGGECAEEREMLDAAGGRGAAELLKATHYHATYVRPGWASRLERTGQIGQHVFYFEDMAKTRGIVAAKGDAQDEPAQEARTEDAAKADKGTELADAAQ